MAFFKYSTITRELLEISDLPLSPGDDEAISELPEVNKETLEQYEWDPGSCSFLDQKKKRITKREFLKRITPFEYAAIKNATSANAIVDYYWQLFMVAEFIDLADPDVMSGIGALEQMGLLSEGRAMEILS